VTAVLSESALVVAAREWYDAGYCVVPSHEDGGKRPYGPWRDYQTKRLNWTDLERLLASGRYTGIGVLTGSASGNVEMLEIEGPIQAAVERLARIMHTADKYDEIGTRDLLLRVSRGCVEQSAGGGLHIFVRITDGPALGNTKLAFSGQGDARKVVSETRGEGGFVVVAPTSARKGHAEGTAYLFVNDGHPSKTVEISSEERDLLHLTFMQALDEAVDSEDLQQEAPEASRVTYQGLSPFDAYRQRVTWASILTPHGWVYSHHSEGRDHWTRPGKNAADGTSATTIEDGPFYCFSTSTEFPAEQGLSKGQVYAHLNHGGDYSAASKALLAAGFGDPGTRHEIPAWEAELDPDATDEERAEAASNWVRERLPILDWHKLWTEEYEEDWLVEPLLSRRRLIALYSAPKVGKSLLMLEIAACLASGRPVLGNQHDQAVRTLYVDFENDPRADVRVRLEAMGFGPSDLNALCYLTFPTLAKLDSSLGGEELLAAITEYGCEVVVIDTVSRAVAGEENENDTWLNFYKHTGMRLKQAGVALIRLDHSGKDETKGQRGGSAKSGDVDAVWRMSRDSEDTFDLICEAQRFPVTQSRLALRRIHDDRGLRHELIGNPVGDKADRLVALLRKHSIDKTLSQNKAKKALRDCGEPFKDIGFGQAWAVYKDLPEVFEAIQGELE
jgi:hypothetical protein